MHQTCSSADLVLEARDLSSHVCLQSQQIRLLGVTTDQELQG